MSVVQMEKSYQIPRINAKIFWWPWEIIIW